MGARRNRIARPRDARRRPAAEPRLRTTRPRRARVVDTRRSIARAAAIAAAQADLARHPPRRVIAGTGGGGILNRARKKCALHKDPLLHPLPYRARETDLPPIVSARRNAGVRDRPTSIAALCAAPPRSR